MSKQLLIQILCSGNKSVRNLKGQASTLKVSSQVSIVSCNEAAARISDSEAEDIMEVETEYTIAYIYDDTFEPSVVIYR